MKNIIKIWLAALKLQKLGCMVDIETQNCMKKNKCPIGIKIGKEVINGINPMELSQIGIFVKEEIMIIDGKTIEIIDIDWQ